MFRILIVEDEPAAARYLGTIVEQGCPGFSVARVAENGAAALALLPELDPDVVLTDVRMPVMDGIELVGMLKIRQPGLPVVIVSGYQEFEYARQALATGAVDYLLKPVKPGLLREVLAGLAPVLKARREAERARVLGGALRDGGLPSSSPVRGDEEFHLALFRSGGLPSRFRPVAAMAEAPLARPDFYCFPGRDAHETLFLASRRSWVYDAFVRTVDEDSPRGAAACSGLVFNREPLLPEALAAAARDLYRSVDRLMVPGEHRIHHGPVEGSREETWDPLAAELLDYAVRHGRREQIGALATALEADWRRRRVSLAGLEGAMHAYLGYLVQRGGEPTPHAEWERDLDEAIAGRDTAAALGAAFRSLLEAMAGPADSAPRTSDVPALYAEISAWVGSHYAQDLTLAALGERFRISSSYVSKLFRKYGRTSFGEYLTHCRIQAARRLLGESPGMPLKDVARRVGFKDAFYFSRVFKHGTGVPPSAYAAGTHPE